MRLQTSALANTTSHAKQHSRLWCYGHKRAEVNDSISHHSGFSICALTTALSPLRARTHTAL